MLHKDIYIILGVLIFVLLSFISSLLFKESLIKLKKKYWFRLISNPNLYKSPIRWFTLIWLFLISIKKKNRFYLKEALTGQLVDGKLNPKVIKILASEPFYRYSIFLYNTIYYHQNQRTIFHSSNNKNMNFLEKVELAINGYHVTNDSVHSKTLEQFRYHMYSWIPNAAHFNQLMNKENHKGNILLKQEEVAAVKLSESLNSNSDDNEDINVRSLNIN